MNSNSTFSLSLQKQIQNENIAIDTEIGRAFDELNIKTILSRSGILKNGDIRQSLCYFWWHCSPF